MMNSISTPTTDPVQKVTVGAITGASLTLLTAILNYYVPFFEHKPITAEISIAATTLLTFIVSYASSPDISETVTQDGLSGRKTDLDSPTIATQTARPVRKVAIGAITGTSLTLLTAVLNYYVPFFEHKPITAEISTAATTLLTFITSYCVPPQEGETTVNDSQGHPTSALTQVHITPAKPVTEPVQRSPRVPGQYAGKLVVPDDFNAPLPDDILAGFVNPADPINPV
jgi:membrane protein YdbS with pleckstrin-like domain